MEQDVDIDDKKQNIKDLLEVVPNKRTNARDITKAENACISEDNVGGSFRMDYTVGWIIMLDGLFCLALIKERSPVPYYLFKKLTLNKLKPCYRTDSGRAQRQGNIFIHRKVINDGLRRARYGGQAVAEEG